MGKRPCGQRAREHGLATDIAIQAMEDGRLGTDNFAFAIKTVLPSVFYRTIRSEKVPYFFIKPGRWAKTFQQIAAASEVHAAVVANGLLEVCRLPTDQWPKATTKLLELLFELSTQWNFAIGHDVRETLGSIKATGKTGQVIKQLLALDETGSSMHRKIMATALDMRVEAANAVGKGL